MNAAQQSRRDDGEEGVAWVPSKPKQPHQRSGAEQSKATPELFLRPTSAPGRRFDASSHRAYVNLIKKTISAAKAEPPRDADRDVVLARIEQLEQLLAHVSKQGEERRAMTRYAFAERLYDVRQREIEHEAAIQKSADQRETRILKAATTYKNDMSLLFSLRSRMTDERTVRCTQHVHNAVTGKTAKVLATLEKEEAAAQKAIQHKLFAAAKRAASASKHNAEVLARREQQQKKELRGDEDPNTEPTLSDSKKKKKEEAATTAAVTGRVTTPGLVPRPPRPAVRLPRTELAAGETPRPSTATEQQQQQQQPVAVSPRVVPDCGSRCVTPRTFAERLRSAEARDQRSAEHTAKEFKMREEYREFVKTTRRLREDTHFARVQGDAEVRLRNGDDILAKESADSERVRRQKQAREKQLSDRSEEKRKTVVHHIQKSLELWNERLNAANSTAYVRWSERADRIAAEVLAAAERETRAAAVDANLDANDIDD